MELRKQNKTQLKKEKKRKKLKKKGRENEVNFCEKKKCVRMPHRDVERLRLEKEGCE